MGTSKYLGFCIAWLGTNGTGKTHDMMKIIREYPKNVLVLMDDDSEDGFDWLDEIPPDKVGKFRGKGVCMVEDSIKEKDQLFTDIYNDFGRVNNEFKGGLLCFDDAMTILEARPREKAKKLFKKRRQRRLDILLNCHGASEFPISLFKNMTHFVICQTFDSHQAIAARMNGDLSRKFVKCIDYVNERAKDDPYFKITFDMKNPPNI